MSRSLLTHFILFLNVFLLAVVAQTTTIPDPDVPGGSIVEVITVDPLQGIPITQTLSSIAPLADEPQDEPTPTPPPAANPPANPARPAAPPPPEPPEPVVGAPPTTTVPVGEGTTQYQYTTVIDGETSVLTDFFTPTYNTPTPPPSPTSGSIMALSDWMAALGTNTVPVVNSGIAQSYPRHLTFSLSVVFIAAYAF